MMLTRIVATTATTPNNTTVMRSSIKMHPTLRLCHAMPTRRTIADTIDVGEHIAQNKKYRA
jgi:hypothetical protein